MRGQIMDWVHIPGIATEVFLMSWMDGGFPLPSLEERQYTMIIRTILDMTSTPDNGLLTIMRTFEEEEEEAQRYNCTTTERKEDYGGFLRRDGELSDLRTYSKPADEGETDLPKLLREDLSVFPRALRAFQELELAIWMTDVTPRLRQDKLSVDFASSKIQPGGIQIRRCFT
jgi:hypothetical protein